MTTYFVNADWTAFVPEGSTSAAFGVAETDVERLGLREQLDAFLAPEPEPPKQAKRAADKMVRAHQDK